MTNLMIDSMARLRPRSSNGTPKHLWTVPMETSVRLLERVPGSPRRTGRRDGLLVVRAITSSVRHHPVMSFGTAAAVVGVGMIAAVRQRRDADLALLAGTDG